LYCYCLPAVGRDYSVIQLFCYWLFSYWKSPARRRRGSREFELVLALALDFVRSSVANGVWNVSRPALAVCKKPISYAENLISRYPPLPQAGNFSLVSTLVYPEHRRRAQPPKNNSMTIFF
jgi:hypothetical protein